MQSHLRSARVIKIRLMVALRKSITVIGANLDMKLHIKMVKEMVLKKHIMAMGNLKLKLHTKTIK